jgi:NAD(P)-dependent dehydrogenase (short-subunit alcohol dehydrogenase family)
MSECLRERHGGLDVLVNNAARVIAKSPVGRLGTPEDIGHAVLYLSASSGSFVTGVSLAVDGGFTLTVF